MSTRCVVLTGLMGAGKTEVGRELADMLGYEFIDTDTLVASRAGKSINQIFDQEGETTFRKMEREIIEELKDTKGAVISVGGGAPTDAANRAILNRLGHVVYLKASPKELFLRMKNDQSRPLLRTKDPEGRLRELLSEREFVYEQANITIDTEDLTVPEVVDKLIDEMAKRTVETQME
ncbi:shikimate kinase [bacterium]|nr:shikimate kinase [bacterium]